MSLKISLLLLGLSISIAFAHRMQLTLKTDEKIRQMQSESLVLAEGHQDTSSMCFSHYNPELNQATANYQVDYDRCLNSYEMSRKNVDNCYKDTRSSIENSVIQSCSALSVCKQESCALTDALKCAANVGAEDAQIFYAISANATDAAAKSKSDYRRVDTQKEICINDAERSYVEETTRVYGLLNGCLQGKGVPSAPTPPHAESTFSTNTPGPYTTPYPTTEG